MTSSQDLLQASFTSLDPHESIAKAYPLFRETDTILVMDGKKFQGVLTKQDVMRAKIPHETKASALVKNTTRLTKGTPLEEIAWRLLESNVNQLPYCDHNDIQGVVSDTAVLTAAANGPFGAAPVRQYMSTPVFFIRPDESVGKAMKVFKEKKISRLPVVDSNNSLVGLLTEEDIIGRFIHPDIRAKGIGGHGEYIGEKDHTLSLPVSGFMTSPLVVMDPETSVKDIVSVMMDHGFNGMLLGSPELIEGIVTKKDLLRPLAASAIVEDPLVIQFAGETDFVEYSAEKALADVRSTLEKYLSFLKNTHVVFRFQRQEDKLRGLQLIHCSAHLSSSRGNYAASDHGWGYRNALHKTTQELEKQVRKHKMERIEEKRVSRRQRRVRSR